MILEQFKIKRTLYAFFIFIYIITECKPKCKPE